MYSKHEYVEMFSKASNDELLGRIASRQLTEEATEAIVHVLEARGLSGESLACKLDEEHRNVYRRRGVTNDCDFCGKSAALSGIRDEGQRFCSSECLEMARSLEAATSLTEQEIRDRAFAIKTGPCPRCKERAPRVELHTRYWVWSAVVVTRWGQDSKILCRKCAKRSSLWSAAECLVFGWWGFPHGLCRTPLQVFRNFAPEPNYEGGMEPSAGLLHATRLIMGKELWRQQTRKS